MSNVDQALKRPENYWELSADEQWGIDKRLGILDWEPTPKEIEEYKSRSKGNLSMRHYRLCAGNPEGLDFVIDMDHEKHFSQEEFEAIAEEAIVFAFEKCYADRGCAFKSSLDQDHIWEYLKMKGFKEPEEITASYYFDPWDSRGFKSGKLTEWLNRKDSEDKPNYMKG